MSYSSLFATTEAALTTLGYTPTTTDRLHSTLLSEGLPIASIDPIELIDHEGEKEVRHTWKMCVKFLCDSKPSRPVAPEVVAKLTSDACSFVALLSQSPAVVDVAVEESVLLATPQTVAGDAALSLLVKVATISCPSEQ